MTATEVMEVVTTMMFTELLLNLFSFPLYFLVLIPGYLKLCLP